MPSQGAKHLLTVKLGRPFFERADHPVHRFTKKQLDQALHDPRFKLEIDEEIQSAFFSTRIFKFPFIIQILKWSILISYLNSHRFTVQRNAARKTFPYPFESYNQVSDQKFVCLASDPGPDAPRQKFRITADIRDKIEHLVRPMRQNSLFSVCRHGSYSAYGFVFSFAARASRSRAKSSPA